MKARIILGVIAILLGLGMASCMLPELRIEFWAPSIVIAGDGDSVTMNYYIKNISSKTLKNCRLEFSIVTKANSDPLDQTEYKVWYPSPFGFDLAPGEQASGLDTFNNPNPLNTYIAAAVLYGAGFDDPDDND